MVMQQSQMPQLGTPAPEFSLPDPSGTHYSLAQFADARLLLVVFICNHCPYVKHILDGLVKFAHDYQSRGVAMVAISANDIANVPEDSPANMASVAAQKGFTFPYLYDESQAVAKSYQAACTPDLFLFDQQRRLAYHGQFDASRPRNTVPVSGADLRAATDAALAGQSIAAQIPSVGCSIKWKTGQQP